MNNEQTIGELSIRDLYQAPRLIEYGRVERMTMGNGGSSLDGNCTYDQRGQGNDGTGPSNPACYE